MEFSSSAEIIANNEHLVAQILLRLPVKPLLRFKSVSKLWFSVISTPYFSSQHTLLNPNHTVSGLFLRSSPSEFNFLSLTNSSASSSFSPLPPHFFDGIKILQSCNGLLLCSDLLPKVAHKRVYHIFNPTTKQLLTLPSLVDANAPAPITVFGLNLAFDPFKSCNYKVICVRSTFNSIHHNQIEIYQSEIRAWRPSGSPFVAPFDMVFDNGVFWNGSIHWISPTGYTLCFNVDKECFFTMPKPQFSSVGFGNTRRFRYFGESVGHLHLIEIYGPRSVQFNVYEMEKDYSFWRVRYQVKLDSVVGAFPEIVRSYLDVEDLNYYAFVVLSLVEGDDEKGSSLVLHIPGKIISYDLNNKSFKKLCESPCNGGSRSRTKHHLQFGWLDAYQCIETLACV